MKSKPIPDLDVNFKSTDPKDFVEVLNKIAEKFGGVTNMGAFADITSIVPSDELKAEVCDEFVEVSVKDMETPELRYTVTRGITSPFDLDYDVMLGKTSSEAEC